jgi:hypothetical protein
LSFEVPIKDPQAENEQMEGIYPWTIQNSVRSVLHLKNTTADPATALVIFDFPDGKFYQPSRIVLQPFESIRVDILALKNSHILDTLKRPFPGDETTGLVQWRQEIPYSLIGRLEQIDLNGRIAHSFSCAATCCANFIESAYVTPDSVTGPVGASVTLQARVRGTDCNGVAFDNPASASWSSKNTSVATVSSGNVSLVGAGTTTITASVVVTQYTTILSQCRQLSSTQNINASVTVTPRLDSISPAKGPIGATTSVTLSGQGFGTSPTINAGSNITATITSKSDTQIQANFAVSSSAAGGNRGVSVTTNGQTSPTLGFFVQIPTSLSIVAGTDSTTAEASCTFTSGGTTFTGCGVTRSFTYQVNDQESPPQPIQTAGLSVWDSFGTVSPNPLNMGGFTTTCSPANTGPCGLTTDSAGRFKEIALGVCSTVCRSNGVCITGGPSVVPQTWHIGTASITQTISYYCSKVLVNGQ